MSPVPVSDANAPPCIERRASRGCRRSAPARSPAGARAAGPPAFFCILYWPSARSESFLPILPSSSAMAVPVPPDSSLPSSGLSSSGGGGGGSSCDALLRARRRVLERREVDVALLESSIGQLEEQQPRAPSDRRGAAGEVRQRRGSRAARTAASRGGAAAGPSDTRNVVLPMRDADLRVRAGSAQIVVRPCAASSASDVDWPPTTISPSMPGAKLNAKSSPCGATSGNSSIAVSSGRSPATQRGSSSGRRTADRPMSRRRPPASRCARCGIRAKADRHHEDTIEPTHPSRRVTRSTVRERASRAVIDARREPTPQPQHA